MAAPSTPTNLYAQVGNGQVYLSWDISAGATSYPVLRSTDNVTFVQIAAPIINNYTDTTAVLGTQYYYQVKASNGTESNATQSQSAVPVQPGQESLGSLRLQAQQRADRVNSNFVTVPEWNKYINQSYLELYDLLVTAYEDYYLAHPYTFSTDGTSSDYTLPDGILIGSDGVQTKPMYKFMGCDLGQSAAQDNNARVTVHKFDFIERNRYVYPNISGTFYGVFNLRYRVMGNVLKFIPVPSAGQYITVWYIPRLATLLADNDICDGVSGWTEYIIVDAAIKALQKEESDVSVLMAEKMALKQRIEESAMNRDAGQPDTISNTRAFSNKGGGFGGPNWDGGFGGF